jgi:hypothetical protein
MSRYTTLACGALLTLGMAAPASAQTKACTLLTKAEVEAAIGRKVTAPLEEQLPQLSGCRFGDPDAPLMNGRPLFAHFTVNVLTFDSPAAADQVFEMGKRNAAAAQAVTGLGDEAFWDDILHTLWVRKGKYELELDVPKDSGGVTAAKALAAKALARLAP